MTRLLAELPGPRIRDLDERSVLVLPTGSVENHGPHLPLCTDALIAEEVTRAAVSGAASDGLDVWQLPTLTVTKSDEHAWAPGTLWLSWQTLMSVVTDLGRSIAATPARTLVFCNGHGGNTALLQVALRELRTRFGLRTFLLPAMTGDPEAFADELGLGIHGGAAETSLVMHLRADLVDLASAAPSVPAALAGYELIGFHSKPVSFGWTSDDFAESGVIGDPTLATAEHGRQVYELSVGQARQALHEIVRFAVQQPTPRGTNR